MKAALIRRWRKEISRGSEPSQVPHVAGLLPSLPPPVDDVSVGVTAGVMAARYVDERSGLWVYPELTRVLDKLGADKLVVFGDHFGSRYASAQLRPFVLIGPDHVPCHAEAHWIGPSDWSLLDRQALVAAADEVVLASKHHSVEAHRVARLMVVDRSDVLVVVGGRKARRRFSHPDIVLVDQFARKVSRFKEERSDAEEVG